MIDLPNNRELYIHRIGRSGRKDDIEILRDIEQYYSIQILEQCSICWSERSGRERKCKRRGKGSEERRLEDLRGGGDSRS
ncbi:hypothetical protein MTR_1g115970 [Medicago truncatula]|uniref:RNA helicase n=1 Tax=Medicago truncatula TaxID=3880 RepID=G7IF11_MEDTR|nr:hypothetical protein MTR_1g115970 [Medicago truncatula]